MFQILIILVNNEDAVIEDIVEAFGKEEGGNRGQVGDKLEGQWCNPLCGTKDTTTSFVLGFISNH